MKLRRTTKKSIDNKKVTKKKRRRTKKGKFQILIYLDLFIAIVLVIGEITRRIVKHSKGKSDPKKISSKQKGL